MVHKTISLQERQQNIHEAITDISRCDSPNNLNGVLAGALFSWKQKMNSKYMHSYSYMDDIYLVLLYTKHITPGKLVALKQYFGHCIAQTLQVIDYNQLMEQHKNELLEEFMQPSKEVA